MKKILRILIAIVILFVIFFSEWFLQNVLDAPRSILDYVSPVKRILMIATVSWVLIESTKILKGRLLRHFDMSSEDNLRSRKLHTQINLLEKIAIFIIALVSIGLMLLSFEGFREIGIGIFASAGVAGIIIGLSAQKMVGTLLAGIQIALTQPFRVDDAVVVENEWGWIEEINLTYIVVRIWDKRRLVLPTTYFLEKPFQNWTRTTADIIGTVFIYTDYSVSFEALRAELSRLLEETSMWDKKVNVLQVTDATATAVEIRILVSARNSPTAWDLRVHIREKMIEFIQKNYPESLPRTRVWLKNTEKLDAPTQSAHNKA